MGCPRAVRACRSACVGAVAICLLPVVLPLLLLWLPLLSFAVAVVRFRRRRRRMMMTRGGRCFHGGDRSPPPESEPDGHRAARLHKYLEDQMELVEEEAGDAMAAVLARNPWAA
ncbi:hypothetical protein CFC21_060887 [Triticum aestivum]|uniref:Uncharacterized protein n=4 Tax=Triticinae TaxID=1648030 RepID=A0A9R1FUW6_WHEAT|nr:uncharacterized protein LOC109775523 [Aegilops tauschii subsp. strangulata]XP_044377679.1 uncharacterized protein LOC123099625 [Triticum aestivum]KAF7035481.1 hypothetical protein CFC21_046354 [Triticum aestivum]KAF7052860.1 hypothetical protein CFC21_060887 [Triticum aestivum]